MVAASKSRLGLVQVLLQHGAQVNVGLRQGETALSLARHSDVSGDKRKEQRRSEIVRLLKTAGAKE